MRKLLLTLAALALMPIHTAYAADIRPYAGIGAGLFEIDPGQNKRATIGGFVFYGLDMHEYFAAELRGGLTGVKEREEFGPLTETFKVNWFVSLLAKPKIEISRNIELYGLIGVTSISTSITPVNSSIQASSTDTGLSFGLGGTYHYNDKVSFGMEWVRYSSNADAATKNTAGFQGMDVNGFTNTVNYQF